MSHFVEVQSVVIDVGAHRYFFCSAPQFKTWYALLVGDIEGVLMF